MVAPIHHQVLPHGWLLVGRSLLPVPGLLNLGVQLLHVVLLRQETWEREAGGDAGSEAASEDAKVYFLLI